MLVVIVRFQDIDSNGTGRDRILKEEEHEYIRFLLKGRGVLSSWNPVRSKVSPSNVTRMKSYFTTRSRMLIVCQGSPYHVRLPIHF